MSSGALARAAMAAVAGFASLAGLACGDDDSATVSFDATDSGFKGAPSVLRPGFTTFEIANEKGDTSRTIVLLKGSAGVTAADLIAAAEAEGGPDLEKAEAVGGSTAMEPGETARIILELTPGLYSVSDVPEGELVNTVTFEVSGEASKRKAPTSKALVEMGPGMSFKVPNGFDGKGTIEIVNRDTDMHEASFIRLGRGVTPEMIADWAMGGFDGPPPEFKFAGGFGPVGEGGRGWVVNDLEDGDYALICFVFSDDGPHFANGMIAEFTVE